MRPSLDGTETDVPIHISFLGRTLRQGISWSTGGLEIPEAIIQSQTFAKPLFFLVGPMILRESGSQTNWLQVNQPNKQTNKQKKNKQTNNQPNKQPNQPTKQPNKQTNKKKKQTTKQTNKQTGNVSNVSGHVFCFQRRTSDLNHPGGCQVQRSPSQGGDLLEPLLRFSERLLGPDLEVRTPVKLVFLVKEDPQGGGQD